jgi:hypothetical protein
LQIRGIELLSWHPYGAQNFEMASGFIENLCAPGVAFAHNWTKSEIYFVAASLFYAEEEVGDRPLAGPSRLFLYVFATSLHVWKPLSLPTTSGRTMPKLHHLLSRFIQNIFCKVTIMPIISIQECDDASA